MGGIGIAEIIGLAIRYGPQIIGVLRAIWPLIEAAKPIVEKLMEEGMDHDTAWEATFKAYEPGSKDERAWFDRAMGNTG